MSPRPKWRIKYIPSFRYSQFPSKAATYRNVEQYRSAYAAGMSSIHEIVVEIDHRNGFGWQTYEVITFPESTSATS